MAKDGDLRYSTLMRVRQRQEELKAGALAEVRRAIRLAEDQRDEIVRQQRLILEQAREVTRREFRGDRVQDYYRYERHLARLAVDLDARIIELRASEAKRRAELEEAYKSRRMVEKLDERERAAIQVSVNRKAQAVLDETATNHAAALSGRNGD